MHNLILEFVNGDVCEEGGGDVTFLYDERKDWRKGKCQVCMSVAARKRWLNTYELFQGYLHPSAIWTALVGLTAAGFSHANRQKHPVNVPGSWKRSVTCYIWAQVCLTQSFTFVAGTSLISSLRLPMAVLQRITASSLLFTWTRWRRADVWSKVHFTECNFKTTCHAGVCSSYLFPGLFKKNDGIFLI